MSRRITFLLVALGIVVLTVASVLTYWLQPESNSTSTAQSFEPSAPATLQARFQSVTGIRSGASTLVSGAIVNLTETPLDASFQITGLPAGVSVNTVLPSISTPLNGKAWSCVALTCSLVSADGGVAQLPSRDGAEVMIALSVASPVDPASTIGVTPSSGAPSTIPLSLPDGEPPLSNTAMSIDIAGPSSLQIGAESTAIIRVANLSDVASDENTITVDIGGQLPSGVVVTPSGTGWECTALLCRYSAALPQFGLAPQLALTLSADPLAPTGSGTISPQLSASVMGTAISANDTLSVSVNSPRSFSVSPRLTLDQPSVIAPTTLSALVSLTPTGAGSMSEGVSFTLNLPDGFDAQWGSVTTEDPWTCANITNGCELTAPIPAAVPSLLAVPISVPFGADPGTYTFELAAVVGQGESAVNQTPVNASLVVLPPPVPELRAVLQVANGDVSTVGRRATQIEFDPGQSRSLVVAVTNEGSVAANEGQTIYLTAVPSSEQELEDIGGPGWKCSAKSGTKLSSSKPLLCSYTLDEDLESAANVQLPFTLIPAAPETANWTLNAGFSKSFDTDIATESVVAVVDDGPQLVSSIINESPLYNGGSGNVSIAIANHGESNAEGGIVVVEIPKEVRVLSVFSPTWTCVNASLPGANGTLTCVSSALITPATYAPAIGLELGTDEPTTAVTLSVWASAPGQYDAEVANPVATSTLTVAGSLMVNAGQDISVVTPQTSSNGTLQPAVVTLTGSADLASASHLMWSQLCIEPGDQNCGGTISPAVTWNGVPPGQLPTTRVASFTAPSQVTETQTLLFQLTGLVGSRAISDQIRVQLVPATMTSAGAGAESGGSGSVVEGVSNGPSTTLAPGQPPAPSARIGTSGTALQVPTNAQAQLIGSGSGQGPLTFAWSQVSGPEAVVIGSSSTQATLLFTAPLLSPEEELATLTFELTVTDSSGATASAQADVQVVWGDNGLQVTLANGAPNVVTSGDSPVTILSQVSSRGTPYSFDWNVSGLALPNGTVTDQSSLSFTTGNQAANGSASLTVTDAFGRVTTASVPVIVSALPANVVPAAFCAAMQSLVAGTPASVTGEGVQFVIPAASVSGTVTPTCSTSTTATFSNASAVLPGGISIGAASGELTVAGLSLSSGTVTVPANWSVTSPALSAGGLFSPFVSSTSIAIPTGSLSASGLPLLSLPGWSGATTVVFTSVPQPVAVVSASGAPTSGSGLVTLIGESVAGATRLSMKATGILQIGPVDLPLSGSLSSSSSESPVDIAVNATLTGPAPLGGDVTLSSAQLSWTPASATGTTALVVGSGSDPLVLIAATTVSSSGTQFSLVSGASSWSAGSGGPSLSLSGVGSIQGNQLVLAVNSTSSTGAWSIAQDLVLTGVQLSMSANCTIGGAQPCSPSMTVAASASSPLFPQTAAISGTTDWSTQEVTLTGTAGTMTVSPIVVSATSLTVVLTPSQLPVSTGSGSTSIEGRIAAAEVDFSTSGTLVAVSLGSQVISGSWTIPAATGYATTSSTNYTTSGGGLGGEVSVPISAGLLTGVGLTQLPSNLSATLPDSANGFVALASFPISGATPSTYTLVTALASPWYLAGDNESAIALIMNTIGFTVTTSGSGVSIAVTGTGAMVSDAVVGSGSTQQSMNFNGALAMSSTGSTLSGSFVPTSGGSWANAFGVPGFSVQSPNLSVSLTSNSSGITSSVTMNGLTQLPTALSTALGISATALPTLSVNFAEPDSCIVIDLNSGGADGVDIGGAGFITSTSASIVLAPQTCTLAPASSTSPAVTVTQGMALVMDGGLLGPVNLSIDTSSFEIADEVALPSLPIGGVNLSNATVKVRTNNGMASISVAGSAQIDSTSVPVSGQVQMPTSPNDVGSLKLTGSLASLSIGWSSISNASLSVDTASISIAQGGTSSVALTGTMSILGIDSAVALTGEIQSGTIDQLLDTSQPNRTFSLNNGTDSLNASFAISYDATQSTSLNLTAGLTTFLSNGFTFPYGSVTIASPTEFTMTANAPVIDSLASVLPIKAAGSYTYSSAETGDYSFTTATVAPVLAGFTTSSTATFSRSGGVAASTQSSNVNLGLFDNGQSVTFTGTIPQSGRASLSATVDGAQIRGLIGNATMSLGLTDLTVTYTTTASACEFWSSDPVLSGVVYQSSGTTYYTFTGAVDFSLPDGLSLSSIPGFGAQPLIVSNESIPGEQNAAPTTSISLNLGFTSFAFSALGEVSFNIGDCAYSIGGDLIVNWGGSEQGDEMASAISPPPNGLQENLGNLFSPDGSLPRTLSVIRASLQADARAAAYALALQSSQDAAQQANDALTQAQTDLSNARTQLANAQAARTTAGANLSTAYQALQAAKTETENAEAFSAFESASEWLERSVATQTAAQEQFEVQRNALVEQTRAVVDAQGVLSTAQEDAQETSRIASDLNTEAQQAATDASNAKQVKTLQVTFTYTYCDTCPSGDSIVANGEVILALEYVVQIGFSHTWDGSGPNITSGSIGGGIDYQFNESVGPLGVYADAELTVTFTFAGVWDGPWTQVGFTGEADAQLDVYLSTYFFTLSATLADVQGTLSFNFVPPGISGSVYIDVLGISGSANFGPVPSRG